MDEYRSHLLEMQNYYTALGQFIHKFTRVEQQVAGLLASTAGLNSKEAIAVFSGLRTDAGKKNIKRLRAAKGMNVCPYLEKGFSQLTIINSARNDIIHHGAEFEISSKEGVVTIMLADGNNRTLPVTVDILNAMTDDLVLISQYMAASQLLTENSLEAITVENWIANKERPWSYKPSATK